MAHKTRPNPKIASKNVIPRMKKEISHERITHNPLATKGRSMMVGTIRIKKKIKIIMFMVSLLLQSRHLAVTFVKS